MKVSTEITVPIGHRLMDYDGDCRFLHGHNYRVRVILVHDFAPGDRKRGMYMDFKMLKAALKQILSPFDHAVMLRSDDPLIGLLYTAGQRVVALENNPTAENLSFHVRGKLRDALNEERISVRVWEMPSSFAEV
jgi:6-pyruvoyltetrahydropterin/6-carboxytetrahydropterin synthase